MSERSEGARSHAKTRADPTASLEGKQAVVAFDPSQVTVEQLIEAVNRIGFKASRKMSAG